MFFVNTFVTSLLTWAMSQETLPRATTTPSRGKEKKKGSGKERLQRAQPPGRAGPGRYLGRNLEQFIRVAPDVMRGAEKGAATARARTPMRAARAVRSEKGRQRNLIPPTGSLFTIDRTEGKITGPTKPPLRAGLACHRDVLIPSLLAFELERVCEMLARCVFGGDAAGQGVTPEKIMM